LSTTQSSVFIAGINGNPTTGSTVVVTSTGQLGYIASSERFKTDIAPMGSITEKLSQLRPVTFKLKSDATGTPQYGLIAEEVEKVYPELVIHDDSGNVQGLRYDELAPMLLRELQEEHATVASLVAQHEADAAKLEAQAAKLAEFEERLSGIQARLAKSPLNDQVLAQR
jgi:hypothetical protein